MTTITLWVILWTSLLGFIQGKWNWRISFLKKKWIKYSLTVFNSFLFQKWYSSVHLNWYLQVSDCVVVQIKELKIIVTHSLIYELISKLLKTEVRINQIPRKCSIFLKYFLNDWEGESLYQTLPRIPLSRNLRTNKINDRDISRDFEKLLLISKIWKFLFFMQYEYCFANCSS